MKFSANLGFLWNTLPLPQAIESAAQCGFDAVECHFPYDTAPAEVLEALENSGLRMLGINTVKGASNGLIAMPDEATALESLRQSLDYAQAIDAAAIHCMAGQAEPGARSTQRFVQRLQWAADQTDRTLLIEPLNTQDAPDYFLNSIHQAADILAQVNRDNVRMMFDVYHVQRLHGEVTLSLRDYLPIIGHVQFAGAPDRGDPRVSELDIGFVLRAAEMAGYTGYFGAEYRSDDPAASLGWMQQFRA
ncbi:MAG: hydroxypyruvate isomerase family protein [Litorivicinus sp.]